MEISKSPCCGSRKPVSKTIKFINPPKTVIYWACLMTLGLVFLAVFRASFLLRHWHLAPGIPYGDIFQSFLLGARFDLSVLAYLVLPFFAVSSLPAIGFEYSRRGRITVQIILYIAFSIIFLLSLIDIEYYAEFGDHLGIWLYSYLDHFSLVWYGLSEGYPWVAYLVIWVAVTAIFIYAAAKLNNLFAAPGKIGVIPRICYSALSLALLAVAMRGSVTLAPLDWGSAYHSNFGFANDLSLNGIFTLGRSLYESYDDTDKHSPTKYHFMESDEALKTVQETILTPTDSLAEPDRSLLRRSNIVSKDSADFNVVIILMESWSAKFVGALGGNPDATPFFDSLSTRGLLFKNFFASGLRTNRGMLSVFCSFPSVPGRTVMKRYGAPHPFLSIADILGKRGYESYFIYGGDLGFENMEGFFRGQHFANFIGIEDFKPEEVLNKWGVADHIVLQRANEIFARSKTPFLGAVITLTNHEPFKLPGKEFEIFPESLEFHDYLNTFHYSDWALGQFFHLAEKEDYYKKTIFVLVGDHGKILGSPDDMLHNFRIAAMIYCPGRDDIKPRAVEAICGQVDLLPTIMGLLGKPVVHESWGRDILEADLNSGGFAFLNRDDSYAWIEDSLMVREVIGVPAQLYKFPSDSLGVDDISAAFPSAFEDMRRKGRAMLQLEVEMVHARGAE
jgi:phosphoglycerol transferase MdoB-like AlkP superfamily enzyme